MSILRLFDVSQYISAGAKSNVVSNGIIEDNGKFKSSEMPCGGVSFLLNTIFEFMDNDTDLVYVFDRPPTIKRKLHESLFPTMHGYKGNRPKKEDSIGFQRALAEDIIKQIGLQVISAEEFEADDCIASIVSIYKDYYDTVYIHSKDSDLYFLVSDNVQAMPVGKQGKIVNLTNWEHTVKTNYIIPFNTLLLNKLLIGEPGDNIPSISKKMADRILSYIPDSLYSKCGDNTQLRNWVLNATDNDPIVMGTLDLLIPLEVPLEYIELDDADVDMQVLDYYGTILGNKYCRNHKPAPYIVGEQTIGHYIDEYTRR